MSESTFQLLNLADLGADEQEVEQRIQLGNSATLVKDLSKQTVFRLRLCFTGVINVPAGTR